MRDSSRRMRELMPSGALLARYGGEELVTLLPGMNLESACHLGETIRQEIQSSRFGPNDRELTISIGAAERQTDETANQTMARADAALYRAKAAGRNCVVIDS